MSSSPMLRLVRHSASLLLIAAALTLVHDGAVEAADDGSRQPQVPSASKTEQPIVTQLKRLVEADPALASSLRASVKAANVEGITGLESYYAFVGDMATRLPTPSMMSDLGHFYFIASQPEGLRQSKAFQGWLNDFVAAWGAFMDTPESAAKLDSFYDDPAFRIEDYQPNPSGWLTFNQFFARQIKPGKRPVASPEDDSIVVSPADSDYWGYWPVSADSKITVKGIEYSITELLADSEYADEFAGGIFTHSFLALTDYHRFHTPVAGTLLEKKRVQGLTFVEILKDAKTGALTINRGTGFQFAQARGLIVLDNESLGLVAVLPIGMNPVSSVTLTPDLGAKLEKGEEFGYFQFGGSDIVTVYQAGKVNLTAEVGKHYLQGEKLGEAQ